MKAREAIAFMGALRGLDWSEGRRRAATFMAELGLDRVIDEKIRKMSKGMAQMIQLIGSIVHAPDLIVLDEPFSGLDPSAVDSMADLLREHTARGIPVLFSSHQLDLVDRLSDSLVILAKGRVVAAGTPGGLRAGAAVRHRLVLSGDAGWTRDLPGIHVADVEGSSAVVEILTPGAERDLLAQALSRGTVHAYAPIVPPLSEIYREVTA